jgi:hypothetical protein
MTASQKLKKMHQADGTVESLKSFARYLASKGDECALEWFKNKSGTAQRADKARRLQKKGPELAAIRQAYKAARAPKGPGKR